MNDQQRIQWPGWRTVGILGAGSFGKVYEIERDVGDTVEKAALKVIRIPQNDSEVEEYRNEGYDEASITAQFQSYLQDIINEYSVMAQLKGHSNVVHCEDIKYVQNENGIGWTIYIKMELLTPIMKVLPCFSNEQEVMKLARDICSALVVCTNKNLIHRDIKPQNIFVSKDGVYKLGDFGIAKTVEKTTGGTKIGTYDYMAPEVFLNKPYGVAADQYSLGMVLYWLLNGRRMPFLPASAGIPTPSMKEAARNRRFSGVPLPPPANGSAALKNIVLKATAFDPAMRFQNAGQMLQALLRAMQGQGGPIIQEDKTVSVRKAPDEPERDEEKTVAILPGHQGRTYGPQEETHRLNGSGLNHEQGWNGNDSTYQRQNSTYENERQKEKQNNITKILLINVTAMAVICLIVLGILLYLKSRPSDTDSKSGDPGDGEVVTVQEPEESEPEAAEPEAAEPEPEPEAPAVEETGNEENAEPPEPAAIKPTGLKKGDIVILGRYNQDDNSSNGYEDVEWIVLATEGNEALLISRYGLERKNYHNRATSATWSNCWLRTWLNGEFYNNTFNEYEREWIVPHAVSPGKNTNFPTVDAGTETTDNVFLLSEKEAYTYFSTNEARMCKPTPHLVGQGAFVRNGNCWWWLRTPGDSTQSAAGISSYGAVQSEGENVDQMGSVRPAIWIDNS